MERGLTWLETIRSAGFSNPFALRFGLGGPRYTLYTGSEREGEYTGCGQESLLTVISGSADVVTALYTGREVDRGRPFHGAMGGVN